MSIDLVVIGSLLLVATCIIAWAKVPMREVRNLYILATLTIALGCATSLPHGSGTFVVFSSASGTVALRLGAAAAWLMSWGLLSAIAAGISLSRQNVKASWFAAASLVILGAIGVSALRDGVSFLIAWELMSLSAAFLLLADRREALSESARSNLFMLTILEFGSVALLIGVIILSIHGTNFSHFRSAWPGLNPIASIGVGILFLIGFGAKLGILPFYEWFPAAYSSGSGASGSILSGVVLNAAWFALARSLFKWMPKSPHLLDFGILVLATGAISSILAILYAFQQNDWRRLLAFSTAENSALAVTILGAAIVFISQGETELASLAWTVGLVHLGGHSLAKGAMMLSADDVYGRSGSYQIRQHKAISQTPWILGMGMVLAAMSLSAMPPLAGFVSEWYIFQTIFHGFAAESLAARLALALAGAGVALTAAIALATMVKVVGIGMLGKQPHNPSTNQMAPQEKLRAYSIFGLGLLVLVYGVGLTFWIKALRYSIPENSGHVTDKMVSGQLLVPLSTGFAFISPLFLIIVGTILSLIPLALIRLRRYGLKPYRSAPLWAQGLSQIPDKSAPTGLVFSNALRQFYSFVYRPKSLAKANANEKGYFVKSMTFEYSEAPIFGPMLFLPIVKLIRKASAQISKTQTGSMNAYLAYLGLALLAIFIVVALV